MLGCLEKQSGGTRYLALSEAYDVYPGIWSNSSTALVTKIRSEDANKTGMYMNGEGAWSCTCYISL